MLTDKFELSDTELEKLVGFSFIECLPDVATFELIFYDPNAKRYMANVYSVEKSNKTYYRIQRYDHDYYQDSNLLSVLIGR